MGEIIKEEIKIDGIYLGLTEEEIKNVFKLRELSSSYIMTQSLTPKWAGRRLDFTIMDMMKNMKIIKELTEDFNKQPKLTKELVGVEESKSIEAMQTDACLKSELCSFNLAANAKGKDEKLFKLLN